MVEKQKKFIRKSHQPLIKLEEGVIRRKRKNTLSFPCLRELKLQVSIIPPWYLLKGVQMKHTHHQRRKIGSCLL
jgi:hypothetical protein